MPRPYNPHAPEGIAYHRAFTAWADRKDILAEGPFPLETTCHNCASVYQFSKDELTELWLPRQ